MTRERVVVICPGRGSYAGAELGYLKRHHASSEDTIARLDRLRSDRGADAVAGLDRLAKFSPTKHLPGRNASNLIYTAALMDFATIDRTRFDIVAICGNSLGWYLSLACAGALSLDNGALLVDTMGDLMEREGVGGQLLVPIASEDWQIDRHRRAMATEIVGAIANAYLSIDLAGTLVLAGDDAAITEMKTEISSSLGEAAVQLPKHAAFHTPLLAGIASKAREALPQDMFEAPQVPLIDGRGKVYSPQATDVGELYRYTLGTQITETYDFARSIEVSVKEFAPDRLILLGPGSSLGAPVAQSLVKCSWKGINSRETFMETQTSNPFLLAMGRDGQREQVAFASTGQAGHLQVS